MYAWKYWRDTRWRFFGYLAGLLACAVGLVSSRWGFMRLGTPAGVLGYWHDSIGGLAGGGWIVMVFAGLALGASGVGDEFKTGTLEFLLTRPRLRRHFIWTGWLVGALELLTMSTTAIAVTMLLLIALTRTLATWAIWSILPILFVSAVVLFSLTYLCMLLARSGREGLGWSLGIVLIYMGASVVVDKLWKTSLPGLSDLLVRTLKPDETYPFVPLAGWILFSLAFPMVAQWLFKRADI